MFSENKIGTEKVKDVFQSGIARCSRCRANLLHDETRGEIICQKCGYVVSQQEINPETERAFIQKGMTERRHNEPSSSIAFPEGSRTKIGKLPIDSGGRKIPRESESSLHRGEMWVSRQSSSKERNLSYAMQMLGRYADKNNIPQHVKEEAAYIYRMLLEHRYIQGRSIDSILVVCLYIACRRYQIPKKINEISKKSGMGRKEQRKLNRKIFRDLVRKFNIEIPPNNLEREIARVANNAGISQKAQIEALRIVKELKKMKISGGPAPGGLASGVVWIACVRYGEGKNQREIADAAGITEVTLRNRYKSIVKSLNLDIE